MIKEANSVWRFFFSGLLCAKLILCACKEWNVCNFCGHTVYGNRLENKTFWLWNMTGEQQDGCVCVYVFPCLYKASAHWRISGYICIIKNRNIISTVEQQQQLDIVPTLNTMTILQECTFLLNFTDNKRIKKKKQLRHIWCAEGHRMVFSRVLTMNIFSCRDFFFPSDLKIQ